MVHSVSNLQEFLDVLGDNDDVIVDFWASFCGPCKLIAPYFTDLSKKYTNVVFIKVDIEVADDIARHAGVVSLPTFIKYRRGAKVAQVVGADKKKLLQLFL